MSDENQALPTASDVAMKLMVPVFNAARPVRVSDEEMRSLGKREKLREGFKRPVIGHLRGNGYEVQELPGSVVITPPKDQTPPAISLADAMAESNDAIEQGQRRVATTGDVVLKADGSGFVD
jgi:hypothetical protein